MTGKIIDWPEPDELHAHQHLAEWCVMADPHPGHTANSSDIGHIDLEDDQITVVLYGDHLTRTEAARFAGALIAAANHEWPADQETAALPLERHSPGQTGVGEGPSTPGDPNETPRAAEPRDLCHACGRPRYPEHDADAPGPTVKHPFKYRAPHQCDERCVCPIHGTQLYYAPGPDDHACQDPTCKYAHGMGVATA